MLPHTRQEELWFLILSTTAGFCEELVYRGYLPWVFAPWLGVPGAMAAVVAIFGLSHAYQGRKGAVRATIAGAVMAVIVMTTGSLIPAMIMHALIDICGGTVGYWLLRDEGSVEKGPHARSPATLTLGRTTADG
jgi:membrane protease YdiL (CAAX protease family)